MRNQLSLQAIKEVRETVESGSAYNFKAGEFKVRLTPSCIVQWNDNVQLNENHPKSDLVFRPTLGLNAVYPISPNNVLHLNLNGGYQQYLRYDELSSWYVQSGSEFAFDFFIKNVTVNLHEVPSYSLDAANQSAVADTGGFGTFKNTSGLSAALNLDSGRVAVGYDHLIVKSITDQFTSQDLSSELFNCLASARLGETLNSGVEATATFTKYDQKLLNDHSSYSAGFLSEWEPGNEFRIQPRVGFTVFQIDQTAQSIRTADLNSWYANLRISGRATETISYTLEAGHEIRTGLASDLIETWYFRPSLRWHIAQNVTLGSSVSYEHGQQGIGNIAGNQTESFDWVGLNGNASWRILERLSLGLDYRLVLRSSELSSRSYKQNIIGLVFTYQTP